MKNKILKFYLKIFGRTSFRRFNRFLLIMGLKGLGITNYQNDYLSGEKYALKKVKNILSNERNPVIFDVGANVGNYSALVRNLFGKDAKIYSFEPVKKNYESLMKVSKKNNFNGYNFGFSDKKGGVKMYYNKNGVSLSHASVHKEVIERIHLKNSTREKVKLEKLDDFCKKTKIGKIDFLKIDVEGHELAVLKGGKNMINKGKIKIIQLEFNEMNLISKTNMLDFLGALKGYNIYRILTNGLALIKPGDIENKFFLFQNILAIKK